MALPADVAQRLREDDEATQSDDDSILIAPREGSTATSEVADPTMNESARSHVGGISEGDASGVSEPSSDKGAPRCAKRSADVPEGSSSEALRRKENAPSDLLKEINIDDSPPGLSFSEGQFRDARAMRTPDAELAHGESDIF